MSDSPFLKPPPRITVPLRFTQRHDPHPIDMVRGIVNTAATAWAAKEPPDVLADIRAATSKVVAAMHAQREAQTRRALAEIERFRDAWRAAEGRPPHVDPPPRSDRTQRARWLRRRATDERARDLHDMHRRLVVQLGTPTFVTDDAFSRDAYRIRGQMYIGMGITSSGGLIRITGV